MFIRSIFINKNLLKNILILILTIKVTLYLDLTLDIKIIIIKFYDIMGQWNKKL